MKKTILFYLAISAIAILVYTLYVGYKEGWDLLPIFINNIKNLDWNGQFNLDFQFYLILSALWLVWRNGFSISSLLFALVCAILGYMIFGFYLLYLFYKENGDVKKILLGKHI